MSDRKFVRVDEKLRNTSTTWLIDLSTVVRLHPDTHFVVFSDGSAMNLTAQSTKDLVKELEGLV